MLIVGGGDYFPRCDVIGRLSPPLDSIYMQAEVEGNKKEDMWNCVSRIIVLQAVLWWWERHNSR
jgi:hypothetical protein